MSLPWLLIHLLGLCQLCLGYVDFGDATRLKVIPTVSIPWPHQLPADWRMRVAVPQHPMITAVAPFLTMDDNGTHTISWSTTHHQYSRHFQNARGIFKRQGGVFQSDASLLATCTPCTSFGGSGGSNTRTATDVCYPGTYSGILAGPAPTGSGGICYGSNYAGALSPTSIASGLPCCPVCTPATNASMVITSGVLATTTSGEIETVTVTTVTSSMVTVTGGTTTMPLVTISVSTITPTSPSIIASPTITTAPNTVVGCGTASGSGTVIGSGTVFLGPGGIFPVTSSGTISGFASKVIGCGTILATSGSFQGSATVKGCGTGTGCAVLTGIGTVFPDALGGLIGITSSGVASGCGKVIGCGTLIGSGTFFIDSPFTETVTPSPPRSTVNVYISYCPPNPFAPLRIADNATDPVATTPHYLNSTVSPTLQPSANSTLNSTSTFDNPLCQLCPNDSGICCPLYAACGADGHCPYTALRDAGYTRFGVNVVDCANSSSALGMVKVEGRVAPGLPGREMDGTGVVRRRSTGKRMHGHGHGHGGELRGRWRR